MKYLTLICWCITNLLLLSYFIGFAQQTEKPLQRNDQWPTATPSSAGLNAAVLKQLDSALLTGEF